jgi:HEAT repeat protein
MPPATDAPLPPADGAGGQATSPDPTSPVAISRAVVARRRHAALAGHRQDEPGARQALADPAPSVRATALGALARMGQLHVGDLVEALADPDPEVRVRAAELAAPFGYPGTGVARRALGDVDPRVVEAACFALGEMGEAAAGAVPALSDVGRDHPDPLCREAAVAALGAIGDPRGLPAIVHATGDKPAVRRRAVLALAPFDGPEVDAVLERASRDRDWQVRQAAEDLTGRAPQ